ncbi:MAG: DUF5679 domain-containing protein [Candidatus Woesearchaeota archaeon]
MEAYCVKCKEKRQIKEPKAVKTENGKFMARGTCPKCGTGMCRIMSQDTAEKAVKSGELKKGY